VQAPCDLPLLVVDPPHAQETGGARVHFRARPCLAARLPALCHVLTPAPALLRLPVCCLPVLRSPTH
jgi:hypothetical protein